MADPGAMSEAVIERARVVRDEVYAVRAKNAKRMQGAPLEEFTRERRTSRLSGGNRE